MHYVKHFSINGIDTKQVACIELHGKPNAATEGAVGVLAIDVDSPQYEVYKCVAVNGSIYTWVALVPEVDTSDKLDSKGLTHSCDDAEGFVSLGIGDGVEFVSDYSVGQIRLRSHDDVESYDTFITADSIAGIPYSTIGRKVYRHHVCVADEEWSIDNYLFYFYSEDSTEITDLSDIPDRARYTHLPNVIELIKYDAVVIPETYSIKNGDITIIGRDMQGNWVSYTLYGCSVMIDDVVEV